jgi:hypothetical protein
MKWLAVLSIVILYGFVANAQSTNGINIYNSKVTINNYYVVQGTNAVQQTNSVAEKKFVVIPQEAIDRLRWEGMLEQRRRAAFGSFLRQRY